MTLLKKYIFIILLLISCFNNVLCDTDYCNFGTCGECISYAHDTCVWCAQDVVADDRRRCQSSSSVNTKKDWCKKESIINPQPFMKIIKNLDFSEIADKVKVQFKPQIIKMKARPGIPIKFDMSYKPAVDSPLDVYFLMDLSYTMRLQMDNLRKQVQIVYNFLSQYTNNIKMGIGSFVEKPGFPFVDPKHISHALKNHVSLTDNMTIVGATIEQIFRRAEFGSNYDDPEAGLDGLMEAMTCNKKIGWRDDARRIILLCTDSTYHSAGDGKIVGAIKPHDMQCHMENNLYTKPLTYDYPSVSQINKIASEKNFIIIFAITKNDLIGYLPEEDYQALVRQILGAKYARLETGVLKVIKEVYEEISRSVRLKVTAPPFIQIDVDQDCISKPTKNCETTHSQPIVNVTGNLTVKSCPTSGHLDYEVQVAPFGLNEKLTIKVEIDCKCDCEKASGVMSSPRCHEAGVFQCGVCKCSPGRYGVDCRCNGTSTDKTDTEKCRLHPKDTNLCSGKGQCRCGKCETCSEGFSGDFCEFNDKSCPMKNGKLCFEKGICTRGRCECDAHWMGKDCGCPDHNRDCIAPYSKEVCSGNGVCQCGVCICNALEGKNETYSGIFCDDCDECAEKRCNELEDYAYCYYEHMENREYCDKKNNVTSTELDVLFMKKTEINGPKLYMAKWCRKQLENGTSIVFKYQVYDYHKLKLTIQKELELPPEVNIWIAVGSAIGLVLLIGLLTVIIWKILVDMHDKRSYEKFKNEAATAGYDVSQNPLYVAPASDFSNPMYSQRQ